MGCYKYSSIFIFLLFLFISKYGIAQSTDTVPPADNIILPIIFYLPETSLGASATGVYTFRFDGETAKSRPSQIIYSAVYTLKNQILLLAPFELWKNDQSLRIEGEVGFFKYFYNFYGIGPDSMDEDLENFDVVFPRLEYTIAKRSFADIYFGGGLKYDYFNITEVDSSGALMRERPEGYDGGHKFNLVALAFRDTRDNIYAPSSGMFAELKFIGSVVHAFSDFEYSKWELDVRHYQELVKEYVLASQIWYTTASNTTPFFDLPYISTPAFARGFNDRRYLNYELLNIQTELRYPIYKKFKGAAFISSSFIPTDNSGLFSRNPLWSYGLGLRYEVDPIDKVRFRLDMAIGGGEFNIYFTLNEAF